MRRSVFLIALAVVALCASPVAWGGLGHRVVARIALSRLTPATRQAVTSILGTEDFVLSATWADEVRSGRPGTYNWHFVDIPYGETRYDAARDCPATERGDCVIAAIARSRHTVANPSADTVARREALKFIIHFVGDLHQPLHAIDLHDRGGNDVRVQTDGPRPGNLHSVWDGGAIGRRGLDEDAYVRLLLEDLRVHPVTPADERIDVVRWAEDAHKVGVADAYSFPGFTPTGPPSAPVTLDDAYYKRAQTAIDRQLQLAGARLAALLNETLGAALLDETLGAALLNSSTRRSVPPDSRRTRRIGQNHAMGSLRDPTGMLSHSQNGATWNASRVLTFATPRSLRLRVSPTPRLHDLRVFYEA